MNNLVYGNVNEGIASWENNQYGTALAPPGCIGESVMLEKDDVCALDD